MRISVDIDEAVLDEVLTLTGEKNKSPALARAVMEYVRRERLREFGTLLRQGSFDYPDQSTEPGSAPVDDASEELPSTPVEHGFGGFNGVD